MSQTPQRLCHTHTFDQHNPLAEKNTLRALILTIVMMVIEITGGWYFNSMALLADGWHMSSHVLALGLALLAYKLTQRFAGDVRFTFGPWKIEVLGGYTGAILLLMVALLMFYHSIERLLSPGEIHYNEAIAIAIVGLVVNLICAWWLKDGHSHGHSHDHSHDHTHHNHSHHQDLNLRSAYLHVITDAATSVLAIIALIGGKLWGAAWLDPVMGIVGGILVAVWAIGLLKESGRALVDAEMGAPITDEVREVIAASPIKAEIVDLHVWRVGRGSYACILSLHTTSDVSPDYFKELLGVHEELVHITIEMYARSNDKQINELHIP